MIFEKELRFFFNDNIRQVLKKAIIFVFNHTTNLQAKTMIIDCYEYSISRLSSLEGNVDRRTYFFDYAHYKLFHCTMEYAEM